MEVWVVTGTTGQYDACQDWDLGWYRSREEAKAATVFLNKVALEAQKLDKNKYDNSRAVAFMSQFDPEFRQDIGGTYYMHYKVPVGPDFTNKKLSKAQLKMLVALASEEE